jgi:hypothetical protein
MGARISASLRPYEGDRPTHVLLRLFGSGLSVVEIFGIGQVGGRVFVGACETVEKKRRVVITWFFPELGNDASRPTLLGAILQQHFARCCTWYR